MGLSAIEIYKILPKKNCAECGFPTCMAFAMQLASMKTQLEKCPYVSNEAKEKLESASAPPIKLVKIGTGDAGVAVGDEVVLFRHEKTFYHPTAFALMIDDEMAEGDIEKKLAEAEALRFERVGQTLTLNMIAVKCTSNDATKFSSVTAKAAQKTKMPLILVSGSPAVIESGVKAIVDKKPLIHAATKENWEAMAKIAKENGCPLVVYNDASLDELADLAEKVKSAGVMDIVLDSGNKPLNKMLENLTKIRRAAIKKTFRPLGYPVLNFISGGDYIDDVVAGALGVMKYASILVFDDTPLWKMLPLMTLRQNIYTDPQKPIQVKPGIYSIGDVTQNSPVMFTTNFSLTYFTVAGDIEKSKMPAYLIAVDSEGLSVMTAFAAGKLTAEMVANALKENGIEKKVAHKKIIIPGMVARMTVKLKEITGWDVMVGPRDSSGIPSFLKNNWS